MQNTIEKIELLLEEVWKVIIGQDELKRDIVIALICGWHILLEGAPWLGKTRLIRAFSESLQLDYSRIQFTPDLLPSDIIGARIYDPDAKEFEIKKGPIFASFVLADEINRAPSKVQSALLEVMEERQVTIAETSFSFWAPFMVLATQNPLEQEGTYELPEAQLDRFLLKTLVYYPSLEDEKQILTWAYTREEQKLQKILGKKDVVSLQKQLEKIEVSESIYEYICCLVAQTRKTDIYPEILFGVSPRASLALLKASSALALISWRDFVIPEDVKEMIYPTFRHRLHMKYEALAQGISSDDMISKILEAVPINAK